MLAPDGKPVAGAKVVRTARKKGDEYDVTEVATTDAEGRFEGKVPAAKYNNYSLVARADGLGADWIDLHTTRPGAEVMFKLVKADTVIRGRVLTLEGKPVKGTTVGVACVATTNDGDLTPVFKLWRTNASMAWLMAGKQLPAPAAAGLPRRLTPDADGRFEIKGVGDNRLVSLLVEGDGIEHAYIRVATIPGFDPKTVTPATTPPGERATVGMSMYGPEFAHAAGPTQVVTGVVRDQKTGKPLAGVVVTGSVPDICWEHEPSVTTDADARYRLIGLPKAAKVRLSFAHADDRWAYLALFKDVRGTDGLAPITVDMEMARGVVVTGRITDRDTGKPVRGMVHYAALLGNKELEKLPGASVYTDGGTACVTGEGGRFRFVAMPGHGYVFVRATRDPELARSYTQAWVTADDRKQPYFQEDKKSGEMFLTAIHQYAFPLAGVNGYRVIAPEVGTEALTLDIALEPGKTVAGRVEDAEGKRVPGAIAAGLSPAPDNTEELKDAAFTAAALEPRHPRIVAAIHPQRKLAGTVQLGGDEKQPAVLRLRKWGAVTGRALDANGEPVAGLAVRVLFHDFRQRFVETADNLVRGKPVYTDRDGRFRIDVPFADQEFSIMLVKEGRLVNIDKALPPRNVAPGEVKDLGDLPVKIGGP